MYHSILYGPVSGLCPGGGIVEFSGRFQRNGESPWGMELWLGGNRHQIAALAGLAPYDCKSGKQARASHIASGRKRPPLSSICRFQNLHHLTQFLCSVFLIQP